MDANEFRPKRRIKLLARRDFLAGKIARPMCSVPCFKAFLRGSVFGRVSLDVKHFFQISRSRYQSSSWSANKVARLRSPAAPPKLPTSVPLETLLILHQVWLTL